jgi:hypothetical protein
MCVILICPQNVRPKSEVLYACHDANPHGAGVAWREAGRVRWQKNLSTGELVTLLKNNKGDIKAAQLLLDRAYGKSKQNIDITTQGEKVTVPTIIFTKDKDNV